MTVSEVLRRVAEIKEKAYDFDVAYAMEAQLHVEVLAAIAVDPKGANRLAKAALETRDIQFQRAAKWTPD